MIRTCVNPLNTDDHNGPGGDQFCIFCLRKRGDDALLMVAQMAALLREIEWSHRSQWGQPQCPKCKGDEWEEGEPRTGHEAECNLSITVAKAEALLA